MPFVPDNKPTPGFVPDKQPQSISDKYHDVMNRAQSELQQHPYQKPADMMADPAMQVMDFANPVPGQLIGRGISAVSGGIRKGGDILLQKAVGLKRYIPGIGETLANEGVIGTRGMMRKQIESGLESRGQQIGSLAESVPSISTQPIAESLGEKASKLIGPDGSILPENATAFNKYVKAASDASAEDSISGATAATRRAQYGKIARDSGRYRDNPAQGLKAQLAGDQQAAYSSALKTSPNAPMGLAEADKAYGALAQANKAAAMPESLSAMGIAGKAAPAIIGGAIGGGPGAAAGAMLSTPLAQSALGRGLVGLGKGINTFGQPIAKYIVNPAATSIASKAPSTLAELLGLDPNTER